MYVDNTASKDLELSVLAHTSASGYFLYGSHTGTSINTSALQAADDAVNFTINNSSNSYEVIAYAAPYPTNWGDSSLLVRGVRNTYTLPGPAR
jgi:hypothetical protein